MKKLLVVLMALAFSMSCASFVAAADTMSGDQPAQTTIKKKKKAHKKKASKKKKKATAAPAAPAK